MRTPMRWLAVGGLVLALAACSGDPEAGSAVGESMADGGGAAVEEGTGAGAPEQPAAEDAGASLGEGLNLGDSTRSMITTGSVTVSAEDPVAAASEITAMVDRLGGWIEGESLQAGSESVDPRAHLVLRIPSRDVGTALGELTDIGKVETIDLERTDVTLQVRDLAARIRAVEMSVARMEDLLSRAASLEELVEAERMLTERQSQLEQLLSQQATLDERVSMSTLAVDVVVPEEVPPPPPEPEEPRTGFLGGLLNGWEAFLDFGSGTLLVVGALLPWLAFAGLVTVLVLWLRRLYLGARPERPARVPRGGPTTTLPPAVQAHHPTPPGGAWPAPGPAAGSPPAPAPGAAPAPEAVPDPGSGSRTGTSAAPDGADADAPADAPAPPR